MARRLMAVAVLLAVALMLGALVDRAACSLAGRQGIRQRDSDRTKITQANWAQYQQFMPESMIHLFKGDLFWKMPANIEI